MWITPGLVSLQEIYYFRFILGFHGIISCERINRRNTHFLSGLFNSVIIYVDVLMNIIYYVMKLTEQLVYGVAEEDVIRYNKLIEFYKHRQFYHVYNSPLNDKQW